jgi:hypothetical protein
MLQLQPPPPAAPLSESAAPMPARTEAIAMSVIEPGVASPVIKGN